MNRSPGSCSDRSVKTFSHSLITGVVRSRPWVTVTNTPESSVTTSRARSHPISDAERPAPSPKASKTLAFAHLAGVVWLFAHERSATSSRGAYGVDGSDGGKGSRRRRDIGLSSKSSAIRSNCERILPRAAGREFGSPTAMNLAIVLRSNTIRLSTGRPALSRHHAASRAVADLSVSDVYGVRPPTSTTEASTKSCIANQVLVSSSGSN